MANSCTLEEVKNLVSSVDLLIYAPPAYGKTTYVTNRRKQLDLSVFDTDCLDCPENSNLEVLVTNYHQLIPVLKSQLVIAFVPPEEQFKSGCEYRSLEYRPSWYSDILDSLQSAGSTKDIIIVNSGAPIVFYERFIHSCVMAIWDCGPLPSVPSPPKSPQKKITHTKETIVIDEDTLDPKITTRVVPITPGSQLMYRDDELDRELDEVCFDIQIREQPSTYPRRRAESLALPPIVRTHNSGDMRKRRITVDDPTCSRNVKVHCPSIEPPPQTDKEKRFVARIFTLLLGLKLPSFEWNVKEDYQVNRGSVKFRSFGSFVTCTSGTYQFHCSRHLFLKWSH